MNTKTLQNLISDLDVYFQWLQELINSNNQQTIHLINFSNGKDNFRKNK